MIFFGYDSWLCYILSTNPRKPSTLLIETFVFRISRKHAFV